MQLVIIAFVAVAGVGGSLHRARRACGPPVRSQSREPEPRKAGSRGQGGRGSQGRSASPTDGTERGEPGAVGDGAPGQIPRRRTSPQPRSRPSPSTSSGSIPVRRCLRVRRRRTPRLRSWPMGNPSPVPRRTRPANGRPSRSAGSRLARSSSRCGRKRARAGRPRASAYAWRSRRPRGPVRRSMPWRLVRCRRRSRSPTTRRHSPGKAGSLRRGSPRS